MTRQSKLLISVAMVLMIFVAALVASDRYLIHLAASKVSDSTGRSLAIKGDSVIDWSFRPEVTLNQVTYENPPWSKHPYMLSIDTLQVKISLGELLTGNVVFPKIIVDGAELYLERKNGEKPNWELSSSDELAVKTAAPDNRFEFPVIEYIDINNGKLHYLDAAQQVELNGSIGVEGKNKDESQAVVFKADGTLKGESLTLNAVLGSYDMLRNSTKPYPVNLHFQAGETEINVSGKIDEPLQLEGVNLKISIAGPNPSYLEPLLTFPLPNLPPYQISGMLHKTGSQWSLKDFSGEVGDSDLSGDIRINTESSPISLTANLQSNRLDFDDLAGLVGGTPDTDETASDKQKSQAEKEVEKPTVLPQKEIGFSALSQLNTDIKFTGKTVITDYFPIDEMQLSLRIKEGMMELEPMSFFVGEGKIVTDIHVDSQGNPPDVSLHADIKNLDLQRILQKLDERLEGFGTFAGKIDLQSTGNSVAEILGNGDGSFDIAMEGGALDSLIVELVGLDIQESISNLLGGENKYEVRCMVGQYELEQGLLNTKLLVIDTTDTNITGEGSINLKDESLDLVLKAYPKDISLFSARAPLLIEGTLKDPSIVPDPVSVSGKGLAAAALGTVLTPLAAIIPFIEGGVGEDSNCSYLINNVDQ